MPGAAFVEALPEAGTIGKELEMGNGCGCVAAALYSLEGLRSEV